MVITRPKGIFIHQGAKRNRFIPPFPFPLYLYAGEKPAKIIIFLKSRGNTEKNCNKMNIDGKAENNVK